jgi:hypothetical protein
VDRGERFAAKLRVGEGGEAEGDGYAENDGAKAAKA